MLTFPKSVIIKFKDIVPYSAPMPMIDIILDKAEEFFVQEKTDLEVNFVDESSTQRYFVDQEAAEEWVNFIKEVTSKYDYDIVEYKIFDV